MAFILRFLSSPFIFANRAMEMARWHHDDTRNGVDFFMRDNSRGRRSGVGRVEMQHKPRFELIASIAVKCLQSGVLKENSRFKHDAAFH